MLKWHLEAFDACPTCLFGTAYVRGSSLRRTSRALADLVYAMRWFIRAFSVVRLLLSCAPVNRTGDVQKPLAETGRRDGPYSSALPTE